VFTFDWLTKRAEISPDKWAIEDVATGRRFTYAQFHERASRLAEFLRDEWAKRPGERVAILAPNCAEIFEALYACAKIGAILVPLNWRLALPELEYILRDADARALIYDPQFTEPARELGQRVGIPQRMVLGEEASEEKWAYEKALAQASGTPVVMPHRPLNDIWHILYTAGTTGRPKGVIQTFGMVFYNAINIGIAIDLTSQDVTLNALPTFHTGGLNLYPNPTFHVGGTAIIQRAFDPAETLRLLSERATAFFGVPAMYLFMSQHPDFEKYDLSRVRSWACGGAPMPVHLLEWYAQRGIIIQQGFGMTETGPTVFLIDREHALSKAGSVGKPQMHVAVRIVDREGRDVPPGEKGELLIKGPGVTPGYWQMPEVTAETIEAGWLHSGDVACVDEDGYYYIVDRWKDMYISGGENVYPAEVENVIYQMEQVAEVAVIGVPDPRWGEVGRAIVVVKPGYTLTEEEVIRFCEGKIARYKIPKSVVFVDRLPRNPAGKVLKTELRQRFGGTFGKTRTSEMLTAGQKVTISRLLTLEDFRRFACLSGDDNPIHTDPDFSARSRFGRPVAHGIFLYGLILGAVGQLLPGPLWVREQDLMFPTPTYAGEEVTVEAEITATYPDNGWAEVHGVVIRPGGELGCESKAMVCRTPEEAWARPPDVNSLSWPPSEGEFLKGFRLGERASLTRIFTEEEVRAYMALTGDGNPLCTDAIIALQWGLARPMLPIGLIGALFSCLLGMHIPGPGTNYLKQRFLFLHPAYPGEELTASVEIVRLRPEKELVNLRTVCHNPAGETICDGLALVLAHDVKQKD